jgi:hypothetical protein
MAFYPFGGYGGYGHGHFGGHFGGHGYRGINNNGAE